MVLKNAFFLMLILFSCLIFSSCKEEADDIGTISRDQLNIEKGQDVEIIYSDSARVKVKVTGPTMIYYTSIGNPRQEFPNGVKTYFFDALQNQQSVLSGKYAIRDERNRKVTVRDSVVWESITDGRLETSELIWDESSNIIRSTKLTKITRQNETIWGFNFETNDKLTQWKILSPKGSMKIDDQQFK